MNDIPDVLRQLADGLTEEKQEGRRFQGFVTLLLDESGKWAGACSGIELPALQELLQHARDDAVLGGKGYAVFVPAEPVVAANAPEIVVPT